MPRLYQRFWEFMMKKTFSLLFILTLCIALQAQRLPAGVVPEHYQLTLTPNLQDATFSGDEIIDVRLTKPSTMITLNTAEIKFTSATVESRGGTVTAKVTLDPDREQANIIAPKTIAAGPARLHIVYTGILNDQLRGFYLSETPKRRYAVTQFEATDARRAFPSFDEPALKATFDISLTVDKGDTAISNEKLIADTPGPGDNKHTLKFATTKKLSTYLVALLVGDFQCIDGSADGIPIRACATPDKKDQGKFALESAEYMMHYYNDYFGIKYPFGKLDLIAIPDFEAGAMENAGAITYRESVMLLDPKVASVNNYEEVASVVAHEMAHQWFGDLVTMQWWDNLWLNEGFATWMESKPVAQWKPEWHQDLQEVSGTNETLNLDALKNTRPIRQKAETPAEISELFDGIAYGKAASVLRMVESYVTPELFRKGVQNYLREHSYANATAENFWNAITQASSKPADKIMSCFVVQPGAPLLHVSQETNGLSVSQERLFSDRQLLGTSQQVWTVPVCPRAVAADSIASCFLLASRGQETKMSANVPIFANGQGRGYYRTEYEPSLRAQLTKQLETGLNPAERISLLGDEWALMRVGRLSISNYLDSAEQLKGERLRPVWNEVLTGIDYMNDKLVTDTDREQFRKFVSNLLNPVYRELQNASDPEEKALRADVFGRLGIAGHDPQVMTEARQLAQKTLQDPGSADPLFAGAALAIAAIDGDDALFNSLIEKLKGTTDQILRGRYMRALQHFEKPELVEKAMELGVSGAIRNQDAPMYLGGFLRNPATRPQAWTFVRKRWNEISKDFNASLFGGSALVASAGQFCDADAASEVNAFFKVHPVPAAERALRQSLERINSCADLKKMQSPNLQTWLIEHGSTQTASSGK